MAGESRETENEDDKVLSSYPSIISMPSTTSIGSSSSESLRRISVHRNSSLRSSIVRHQVVPADDQGPTISKDQLIRSSSSAALAESELFRRELEKSMKEDQTIAKRMKKSATLRWRQLRDHTTTRKKANQLTLRTRRKSVSGATAISEAIQQRRVKQQKAKIHRQEQEQEHQHMIKLFNLRKLSITGFAEGEAGRHSCSSDSDSEEDRESRCRSTHPNLSTSSSMDRDVKKRKKRRHRQFLIHPDSTTLRVWYLFLGSIIGFQVIYIPFIVCFQPDIEGTGWEMLDHVLTIFFWVDIVLHFNIGYYRDISIDDVDPQSIASKFASESIDKKSRLVMNRKMIARHYILKWFWLDLSAAFPFDQMLSTDSGLSSEALGLFKGFRLPRLLGLLRLLRVVKMLRVRREFIYWLKYSSISNILRLARVMLVMFTLVHIFSCVWFIILSNGEWGNQNFQLEDELDLIYSKTFYSTLLMMMGEAIGPITRDEHIFCSVMVIGGAVVMAVIFGNVAMLVSTFYADSSRYHDKMESVYQCMNHLALPSHLQDRIQKYYKFLWQQYHTLNGNTIQFVEELSSNLQLEVNLFLNASLIRNIQFLRDCSPEVVQELVLHLETRIYMPHDYIIHKDEVGVEMYFVQRGECEVLALSNKTMKETVLKVIQPGNYFGEIALMMDSRRTASVRARTFCTLCVLHRIHFQKVLDRYKEDKEELEQMIMRRYIKAGDKIKMKSVNEDELEAVQAKMMQKQMSTVNIQNVLETLHQINTRLHKLEQDHQGRRPSPQQYYARKHPVTLPAKNASAARRSSLQHSKSFDENHTQFRRSSVGSSNIVLTNNGNNPNL